MRTIQDIKLIPIRNYLAQRGITPKQENARRAGITLSEYLRRAAASSVVREQLRPQHLQHILQLTSMANNLNQISRKANAAGYVSARTEYRYLASEIDDLISRIKDDR